MSLDAALAPLGLAVLGVAGRRVLVGALPAMWEVFTASAEFSDGAPDPLDRWSRRVLGAVAEHEGADLVMPSDGPPFPPVMAWALETGRFWQSPVGMLVHAAAGLWVSVRGVLVFDTDQSGPPAAANPCPACAAPCRSACPVDALKGETYDVAACKDHVQSDAGRDCREMGCRARRACPVSQRFGRDPAQSAFHMEAFL